MDFLLLNIITEQRGKFIPNGPFYILNGFSMFVSFKSSIIQIQKHKKIMMKIKFQQKKQLKILNQV